MLLLLLTVAFFQLAAQKAEIDQRPLEEVKAKAQAGDAESEYQLGLRYYNGESVAKDFAEAVKWFGKAAEQGFAPAQSDLGRSYLNGEGVPKDVAEAVKWFRKAAEQNFAKAQNNLGLCYAKGDGVAKDDAGGGEVVSQSRRAESRRGSIQFGRPLRGWARRAKG